MNPGRIHLRKRYLLLLLAAAVGIGAAGQVALAASPPAPTPERCAACHPGPARDWSRSAMAKGFGCEVCHGSGHQGEADVAKVTQPTPNTCRACHPEQAEGFARSKHALGWAALQVVPNYRVVPRAARAAGCEGCHQVGQTWPDGSQGKCNTCHGRHSFSKKEAAEPEACGYCHRGDHPQFKIWEGSRHGQLYLQTRDETRAPKCQTCHLQKGDHDVRTAWGFLGLRPEEPDPEWAELRRPVERALGDLGPGHAPQVKRDNLAGWQASRDKMIQTCAGCHSQTFARTKLAEGDALLKESDRVFARVCELSYTLRDQGVLEENERVAVVREALAHRLSSFMGAFHNGYEYAWDDGYLALADDLLRLKGEAVSGSVLKAIQRKLNLKLPLELPATK